MATTKESRAAVVDGMAITARHRERQLSALHRGLSASSKQLTQVLADASGSTTAEATAEFLLTLNAIKEFHRTTDPKACHEDEYKPAEGKDQNERRVPYGYAYIVPERHSPLYSTIVPLAAAIAAGNIVLLQASKPDSIAAHLEKILSRALYRDSFSVVEQDAFDEEFQQAHRVYLDGVAPTSAKSASNRLVSPTLRVAAVVDRSADFNSAAKDIVRARFGFGGSAPFAPDIVLVNDFSVSKFSRAVAEAGLQYLAQSANGTTSRKLSADSSAHLERVVEKDGTILVSGEKGKIVLLQSRDSRLLSGKITTPTLLLMPITSMDDAIDFLNKNHPLMAAYIYAAPAAGKYISQFIRSESSFINHLPTELLVGGPAVNGYKLSLHPRYTIEMFSRPSPVLSNPTAQSVALQTLISLADGPQQRKAADAVIDTRLEVFKEPFGPPVGFFEQGFLFGASIALSTLGVAGFYATKYGYLTVTSLLHK